MCLYTTQKVPKIAEKDIICYKVLEICNSEWNLESSRKRKSKKTVLMSYFHSDFKWNIDKHYRSKLVIIQRHVVTCFDSYNNLVSNAFHSYQTLESAKLFCRNISYQSDMDPCAIVRCIIPKGAKYCEGMHSDGSDGYASNQIIMKEIVDFKEIYPDFDFDKYPYKQGQLVYISDSVFPISKFTRVNNIIPLDSNTVRLRVGLMTFYTDINGIPVSMPVSMSIPSFSIKIHNDKETK